MTCASACSWPTSRRTCPSTVRRDAPTWCSGTSAGLARSARRVPWRRRRRACCAQAVSWRRWCTDGCGCSSRCTAAVARQSSPRSRDSATTRGSDVPSSLVAGASQCCCAPRRQRSLLLAAGRSVWRCRMADAVAVLPGLRASERYCEQMARREAANFYWGFIALPRAQRTAIYALYDFARQVDDDADLVSGADRAALLQRHRSRLRTARAGDTTDPVMSVLAAAMTRFSIPREEVEMLIDGVAMDLDTT